MHIMWFTERAYHYDPEADPERYRQLENQIIRNRSFFGTPNRYFDPAHGSKLLNQYLDEKIYSDELGFDGLMLNEHHATPFCLGSVMDVEAAILARVTRRAKIVLLGNPVPTVGNALRMAEELAMIDLISSGRLIPGWVRGAGSEQLANNANPAYNREYFEEGVEFIVKAWTTPGPFRYEGKHFHYRFVNPWVLPHPETPSSDLDPRTGEPRHRDLVREKALPVHRAGDQARADGRALGHLYGRRRTRGLPGRAGEFRLPTAGVRRRHPGARRGARQALPVRGQLRALRAARMDVPAGIQFQRGRPPHGAASANPNLPGKPIHKGGGNETDEELEPIKRAIYEGYPQARKDLQMIAGTPDTVVRELRKVLEVLRPGIFAFWIDGPVAVKDRMRCIQLLGKEVMPAVREIGKELGLCDPFERAPGSRPLASGRRPERVAQADALAALE